MTSQHTKQGPFESLASPLEKANVFYLALKIGYIYIYIYIYIYRQTHTYTQSGAENSLSQFCLTITKPFSPFYLKETTNY